MPPATTCRPDGATRQASIDRPRSLTTRHSRTRVGSMPGPDCGFAGFIGLSQLNRTLVGPAAVSQIGTSSPSTVWDRLDRMPSAFNRVWNNGAASTLPSVTSVPLALVLPYTAPRGKPAPPSTHDHEWLQ